MDGTTQRANSEQTVYERLAEFHDLFMAEPWERLRPHVAAAFSGLPAGAVIAELGAGTGMGTRVVAQESSARLVALEPSLIMRSMLTARVADDADLAARVTVVAGAVPDDLGRLPGRIDGFLCAHMLGHLDAVGRRALFAWMDAHLSEAGTGLITTQERHEADLEGARSRPGRTTTQSRVLGEYEYRAVYEEAATTDEFSTRYEVWQDQTKIREAEFTGRWEVVTVGDIASELAGLRLTVDPVDTGTALIRRP